MMNGENGRNEGDVLGECLLCLLSPIISMELAICLEVMREVSTVLFCGG